jgi:ribonuclease HII
VCASGVGWATSAEIDEVGIIRALGLAAHRAIAQLAAAGCDLTDALVLLDGNHDYITPVQATPRPDRPVVKGDRDCASASAASVIAKVARDEHMRGLDVEFPVYGWSRNKGYASIDHRTAIREHGLSRHHRASWAIMDAPTLF